MAKPERPHLPLTGCWVCQHGQHLCNCPDKETQCDCLTLNRG